MLNKVEAMIGKKRLSKPNIRTNSKAVKKAEIQIKFHNFISGESAKNKIMVVRKKAVEPSVVF